MPQINYQIKIAICDDDPKDRAYIRQFVSEYLDIHHYHIGIDEYESGESFLDGAISKYSPASRLPMR